MRLPALKVSYLGMPSYLSKRCWIAVVAALVLLSGCVPMDDDVSTEETDPTVDESPEAEAQANPLPPLEELSAPDHRRRAIGYLEQGEWLLALRHLERSLELRPGQRQATMLLEQLNVDPNEYLDTQSFDYVVKPGQSLSDIAKAQLGDSLKFPILARYNGITNPSALRAGQTIRLPGQGPKPELVKPRLSSAELAAQSDQAETNGQLEEAYRLIGEAIKIETDNAELAEHQRRIRGKLIDQYSDVAYQKEQEKKLDEAVQYWERVLKLDPKNIPAQFNLKGLRRAQKAGN